MNQRGFTLIELLVAIVIFAFGIVGVAKMQSEALMGSSFGMQLTEAMNVAQNEMERLSGLGLTSADLVVGQHTGGTETHQGIAYQSRWDVVSVGTNERQVEVHVSWNDRNATHDINVDFIRGRH